MLVSLYYTIELTEAPSLSPSTSRPPDNELLASVSLGAERMQSAFLSSMRSVTRGTGVIVKLKSSQVYADYLHTPTLG
jgi:hypothetical protein